MKQVLVYLKFSRVLHKNLHCTPLFVLTALMRGICSCIRLLHRKVWFIHYVTVDLHLSYTFVLSFGSCIVDKVISKSWGQYMSPKVNTFNILDAPCYMWELTSPTRNWTHTPCIGRQGLNHCTIGEVPVIYFKRTKYYLMTQTMETEK